MTTGNDLIIRDQKVSEDSRGNLNLTDIWRMAGSPGAKRTSHWRELPTTDEYLDAVAQNVGKSYVKGKNDAKSVIYSKTGKGGGTFGQILVAIAYAEYLNPDLAIEIKQTYLRVQSGDLTLVDEILEKADDARKWQGTRDASKLARETFTAVLQSRDCNGADIGYVTNAIYVVLLGGKVNDVKASRNLPAKASLRDNLPLKELVQTMATEVMASERIEDEDRRGRRECYDATARAAGFVRDAFEKERADRKPR
jgi:hypothetical protein